MERSRCFSFHSYSNADQCFSQEPGHTHVGPNGQTQLRYNPQLAWGAFLLFLLYFQKIHLPYNKRSRPKIAVI